MFLSSAKLGILSVNTGSVGLNRVLLDAPKAGDSLAGIRFAAFLTPNGESV